jgi:hypothetical protein
MNRLCWLKTKQRLAKVFRIMKVYNKKLIIQTITKKLYKRIYDTKRTLYNKAVLHIFGV